jgi:hypothetical protein
MTWRKIEVEFMDSDYDAEEMKAEIEDLFATHKGGLLLAQVTIDTDKNPCEDMVENVIVPVGVQATATNLGMTVPNDPDDMAKLAILRHGNDKIAAIKDLRTQAGNAGMAAIYGLKEAKDLIDKHWKNP